MENEEMKRSSMADYMRQRLYLIQLHVDALFKGKVSPQNMLIAINEVIAMLEETAAAYASEEFAASLSDLREFRKIVEAYGDGRILQ